MKMLIGPALGMLAGVAIGAAAVQGVHAQAKPPVYFVTEITVNSPKAYAKEYAPKAQAITKSHGGQFTSAGAQTFGDGLTAFNAGDYSSAYSIWLPLAQHGDANSQSSLGYLFHEGKGVRQNSRRAAKWYGLAASQGEPTAQSFLCEMYWRGDGLKRNLVLALMWCELSIDGGETRSMYAREHVLDQMTTAQRNMAWDLVTKWRATPWYMNAPAVAANH
jgi:uncharacterized protein